MTRKAVKTLQVVCARKRWIIAIGNHRNVLISYSRYPLDGTLDLSDFTVSDFDGLSAFFKARTTNSTWISCNGKWFFELTHRYLLKIRFNHHPFDGVLELGEVSKDECKFLCELFQTAKTTF